MTAVPFDNGMAGQGPRGHCRSRRFAGRHRHRRDHRSHVRILRFLRLCDRFGAGVPEGLFPLRSPASGDAVVVLAVCAGLSGPSGGVGGRSWAVDRMLGREAKLTIALFLLGGSTAAIAFLPGYETLGARAIWLLALFPAGAGLRAGRHLGWPGLAAGAQRAREPARLVCDDPATWRAAGPDRGEPAVRVPSPHRCPSPISLNGAGAIRSSSPSRSTSLPCSRGCAWWRRPSSGGCTNRAIFRPRRWLETVSREWRTVAIGVFAPLASFALFHMVTVFPLSLGTAVHARTADQLPADRRPARRRSACWQSSRRACWPTASGAAACWWFRPRRSPCSAGSRRNCWGWVRAARSPSWCWASILLGLAFGQSSGAVLVETSPRAIVIPVRR